MADQTIKFYEELWNAVETQQLHEKISDEEVKITVSPQHLYNIGLYAVTTAIFDKEKETTWAEAEQYAKESIWFALALTCDALDKCIEDKPCSIIVYDIFQQLMVDKEFRITYYYALQILIHNHRLQLLEPYEASLTSFEDHKFYDSVFKKSFVYNEFEKFPIVLALSNPLPEIPVFIDYPVAFDLVNLYKDGMEQFPWLKMCKNQLYFNLLMRKILSHKTYMDKFKLAKGIYDSLYENEYHQSIINNRIYTTDDPYLSAFDHEKIKYPMTASEWAEKYCTLYDMGISKATTKIQEFREKTLFNLYQDELFGPNKVTHQQLVIDIMNEIKDWIDIDKLGHKKFVDLIGRGDLFTRTVFDKAKRIFKNK